MRLFFGIILLVTLTSCSGKGYSPTAVDAPLVALVDKAPSRSQAMVVTANPHASNVGAEILRAGGSAVDAALAIQAVLSLVEPQSSGLGGGGFMLHFDNQSNEITVYDGRETAPQEAEAGMFLNPEGDSIGYLNAKHSGLSTGVPGVVSLFQLAHQDHGKLPWGVHFDRAIELAELGFEISPRLHSFIERFGKYIPASKEDGPVDAYHYFFHADGTPRALGSKRTNLAYAKTLQTLARDPQAFYTGEIAQEIVAQVALAPRAGRLSLADMAAYKAQRHQPVCKAYRAKRLCGPPPPSSWVAVGMIAGLLESAPAFSEGGAQDPDNWSIFADAQRLAYADRDQYVADAGYVDVPLSGLLDQRYLSRRSKQIQRGKAIESIAPGDPWPYEEQAKVAYGVDATSDVAGTTHFVVVDNDGNVVSMTASVESIFGSTRMAGGMFLNNQLTDFSFKERDEQGRLIANRVEPGKHPRSSMSPTIVLDEDGEFYMATGSPGGNSIIAYTAKTLVGVMDWGLSPQAAVDLPNMVARGDGLRIEQERASPALIQGLRDAGFEVKESAGENSGLSVVVKDADGGLQGGVDPRREGVIEVVD